MLPNLLLQNLTIFSVFEVILIRESYRTMYLYTTSDSVFSHDVLSTLSELSHKAMIPVSVMSINQDPIKRSRTEEPILNVFLAENLSSTDEQLQINKHLYPKEINLISLATGNETANEINFELWMNFGKKLLIVSNRFIAALSPSIRLKRIHSLPIDTTTTTNLVNHFISEPLDGTYVNVFMQHLPSESAVTAAITGYMFTGPDGSLTELLIKSLNATADFWSDIGVMYPSFREWKYNPMVAPRLHYQYYHKEVYTSNFITSCERR